MSAIWWPDRDTLADVIRSVLDGWSAGELTDDDTDGEDVDVAEGVANVLLRKFPSLSMRGLVPMTVECRDALVADLRTAARSSVLMPEFGSDGVASLKRWADVLAGSESPKEAPE